MKKFVSFLLLCLFLFTLSTASAQADTAKDLPPAPDYKPVYDIDVTWKYSKLCVGKINTAIITITNPTGEEIPGFTFTIEYDSDKLEFVDYTSDWDATLLASHANNAHSAFSGNMPATGGHVYANYKALLPGRASLAVISNNANLTMGSGDFLINQEAIAALGQLQLPNGETLPQTGFSATMPFVLDTMPMELAYEPMSWMLDIPSLSVEAEIVKVPFVDKEYPVAWLENKVGLLEGSENPGEGITVIAGHNNLNATEIGPFALLKLMEKGDRIFVQNANGEMLMYTVYANEKISASDADALAQVASQYEKSLTLMTCEDEMISGGFANRRIVAARLIEN